MNFRTLFIQLTAIALVHGATAMPSVLTREAELSCQACEWFGGSDTCCSASCIAQKKGYHGGYCNDHEVCICTH
ncbi:hypothetical protein BDQ17DRAFT_1368513 [Cyathus striatus]|nr:hypothetical protein BDQ17DRAFT_1368513 [Cyathus striatus]